MKILEQTKNLVSELKDTSSSLEKKEILKKHLVNNDLKKIVYYTYNPLYQFYITSDVCEKNHHLTGKEFNCIFDLLDSLRTRKLTGHDAVGAVNTFVSNNPDYKDIIYSIIDKDLKTRTAEKTINSAVKNLIPEFEVALADKYDEKNVSFKDTWYASQKMDGCVDYDTIVEFKDGKKLPIGYVVDNKVLGEVKCYNHKNKKIEYKCILNYMKNIEDISKDETNWYEIELENGHKLKITGNDTIYLPELKCYRKVEELKGDEKVLFD